MQTGVSFAIVVGLMSLVFSGCVSGGTDENAPTTSAPVAAPTVETGTISGILVTEDELPIAKVGVVVKETDNETLTDATGAFTFNGLAPGTYTVLASALGFESLARQIDVLAGEVADVRYVMAAVVIKAEPYYVMTPYEGMVQCAFNPYYSVHPCGGVTGEDTDQFLLTTEPTMPLEEVVLELVWTPATPGTAETMEIDFCDATAERQADVLCLENNYYQYQTSGSPNVMRLGDVPIKDYNEWIVGAGSGFTEATFSLQQRFTIYVTFCMLEACAEDYSAIPPA
jgi:hypothetical protein